MEKVFTGEQAKIIIEIGDKLHEKDSFGLLSYDEQSARELMCNTDLVSQIRFGQLKQEIEALMNPLTRPLVYDDLVRTDQYKFYFNGAQVNRDNVSEAWYLDNDISISQTTFTKDEIIIESPFDIDFLEAVEV